MPKTQDYVQSIGLSGTVTVQAQYLTTFQISSLNEVFSRNIRAYILQEISPKRPLCSFNLDLPAQKIKLADPTFNKVGNIDMLLGGDIDAAISKSKILKTDHNKLSFKETKLGWVVNGELPKSQCMVSQHVSDVVLENLDKSLRIFWESEEIDNSSRSLTSDEALAEQLYDSTTYRLTNGNYVVSLPFKDKKIGFTRMRQIATQRFVSLERRLWSNDGLRSQYFNVLQEYLNLGHIEEVKADTYPDGYYIPHHCVMKESSSTPCRVVFDASAKDAKLESLNEHLLTGPRLQITLLDLLLKFRSYKYAFTADIEKMYRQIWINPNDHRYQLMLMRTDPDTDLKSYVLKTVTFGTTSAPYLAVKTLYRLAQDEEHKFPIGARCLREGFYVDDFICGADTLDEALTIQVQTIGILNSAGFNLRKWSSNTEELLCEIPVCDREMKSLLSFNEKDCVKTLGINWSPRDDMFSYVIQVQYHNVDNKRNMLSDIGKIFDPLGWISPVTIVAKMLIQITWMKKLDWDSPLPEEILSTWLNFKKQLHVLSCLKVPRWLGTFLGDNIELHGFADASEKAYGAVIYVKNSSVCGQQMQILVSKTKVAPLKKISLPRLELNAALLLARLMVHVREILGFQNLKVYCWSDSMITLAWIRDHPRKRTTYVANRVSEIQSVSNIQNWFHVRSADNPADLCSRGIMPQDLITSDLWWHGPTFLIDFKPEDYVSTGIEAELPPSENRKPISKAARENTLCIQTLMSQSKCSIMESVANVHKFEFNNEILNKFSSLSKICRIVAYCKRFLKGNRQDHLHIGPIEYDNALRIVLTMVQVESYGKEINDLKANSNICSKSSVCNLSPFIDSNDGLLRINSRLGKAEHLPYDQRFPIILPYDHIISTLIVREAHLSTLHGTQQQTWMYVAQRYHIIKCKQLVRKIVHNCVKCYRFRHMVQSQQMAQLPASRLKPERPFLVCGVDLAGPFEIKKWKGKCNRFYKTYFAIFVCFCTKAVHIELVVDLSAKEFIATFRRFIARRGIPKTVHSDCGTNFVGAESVITRSKIECLRQWNNDMANSMSEFKTEWKFNPPASPHFGGLWESGVKSVKHHIKRVMGQTKLSYDEFETLLLQIEATLNSRPLCKLDGNPDTEVITAGHFLIQGALNALPDRNLSAANISRLDRFEYIERLHQEFWKIWSNDYLNTLRQRQKWRKEVENIKENDIVLVKENNVPPNMWITGRVIKVHIGSDNLVRVATVKVGSSMIDRPIVKLCPLPIK